MRSSCEPHLVAGKMIADGQLNKSNLNHTPEAETHFKIVDQSFCKTQSNNGPQKRLRFTVVAE